MIDLTIDIRAKVASFIIKETIVQGEVVVGCTIVLWRQLSVEGKIITGDINCFVAVAKWAKLQLNRGAGAAMPLRRKSCILTTLLEKSLTLTK